MINRIAYNPSKQNFTGHHGSNSDMTNRQKAIVWSSAAAGMAPVMAVLAKRKGFSLNPVKIVKTPIKDWALFKYAPKGKAIEFEAPQIISVATGSVAGGFIGGAIVDKNNIKAKKREVLNQLLGNVLVPVGCVWAGSELFNKYSAHIERVIPQFNNPKKTVQILNKCLKNIPNAICTVAFLAAGIFAGNKVSNLINDRLYHRKVERDIKATDFAPHIDDVCMATSMMNKDASFGAKLGRVIPFALLVPGYETGIAQKKN